jgi:hypothetical protein
LQGLPSSHLTRKDRHRSQALVRLDFDTERGELIPVLPLVSMELVNVANMFEQGQLLFMGCSLPDSSRVVTRALKLEDVVEFEVTND